MKTAGLFSFAKTAAIKNQFTFNKKEKLKSRKLIEQLFSKGKSLSAFPLKVLYEFSGDEQPLKAGVAASKKSFKKAVDRNRVKRVVREAYRLQKLPLEHAVSAQHKSLALFFIFTGRELPTFEVVQAKMALLLQKLTETIQPENQ